MLTFEWIKPNLTAVFKNGKRVGKIIKDDSGWFYLPKGHNIGGLIYDTLEDCQNALEEGEQMLPYRVKMQMIYQKNVRKKLGGE